MSEFNNSFNDALNNNITTQRNLQNSSPFNENVALNLTIGRSSENADDHVSIYTPRRRTNVQNDQDKESTCKIVNAMLDGSYCKYLETKMKRPLTEEEQSAAKRKLERIELTKDIIRKWMRKEVFEQTKSVFVQKDRLDCKARRLNFQEHQLAMERRSIKEEKARLRNFMLQHLNRFPKNEVRRMFKE